MKCAMKIPVVFGLAGVLSGGLTVAEVLFAKDVFFLPGLFFAIGLASATWLTRRRAQEKIVAARIAKALLPIVLGYPAVVWLLAQVSVVVSHLLRVFLDSRSTASSALPIGYWVGLLCAGVAAAALLWFSLRLLAAPHSAASDSLWLMVGGALSVCLVGIAADLAMVEYYGFSLHSEQRARAGWTIIFLLGNTVMSFLYGNSARKALVQGTPETSRSV